MKDINHIVLIQAIGVEVSTVWLATWRLDDGKAVCSVE